MEENKRFSILRKELDLTLDKFGKKLGITGSAVGNIEKGRRALTDQVILSVVREFNVNEDWLRHGEGPMFIETKEGYLEELSKQFALDEIDVALIEAYLELSPSKRAAIKEYISLVARSYPAKTEEELEKERIDAEVESYRRELEAEAKGAEKSLASEDGKDNIGNKKEAN